MAHMLALGLVAEERRRRASPDPRSVDCTACSDDEFSKLHGGHEGFDRRGRSCPGDPSAFEWQLPLPPVRFPLRDALLSFQDGVRQLSPRSASTAAEAAANRGPLKVCHTQKSRAMREVGRQRRAGVHYDDRIDRQEMPLAPPVVPEEALRPSPAKKVLPSKSSMDKKAMQRSVEDAGRCSWPRVEESLTEARATGGGGGTVMGKSASDSALVQDGIRPTWTSATRAVMSHSRRAATETSPGSRIGGDTEPTMNSMASTWLSMQSSRALPRSVKDWAARGHEFTDGGLGIGDRFVTHPSEDPAYRSPGPSAYRNQVYGSVSRYVSTSCLPTRQPEARHYSAEVHKMGARRDTSGKVDRQRPAPGTYELKGFVDELVERGTRRVRRQADAAGSKQSAATSK
eukprot:TRINITY_DN7206_c0_g4_i2.p1 TRINITY_DN7206_c0_g4~~TRINITY_DN7206_c0_g4_i2.p1  ORF type:complete len:400 (-),score=63.33 TRINITY_DN7206_c0_g4_i2:42-1241(-)